MLISLVLLDHTPAMVTLLALPAAQGAMPSVHPSHAQVVPRENTRMHPAPRAAPRAERAHIRGQRRRFAHPAAPERTCRLWEAPPALAAPPGPSPHLQGPHRPRPARFAPRAFTPSGQLRRAHRAASALINPRRVARRARLAPPRRTPALGQLSAPRVLWVPRRRTRAPETASRAPRATIPRRARPRVPRAPLESSVKEAGRRVPIAARDYSPSPAGRERVRAATAASSQRARAPFSARLALPEPTR